MEPESCEKKADQFKQVPQTITLKNHVFSKTKKTKSKKSYEDLNDDKYGDLNEDEINELESAEFMESEASKLIQGDVAAMETGDDHPYYLLKLLQDPYETEGTLSDDYNHEFPPLYRVAEGNYFELHKTTNEGDIYYMDTKNRAIISAFCVAGNCPPPVILMKKQRGKEQEMYLIDHDLHETLCEIVNFSDSII